MPDKRFRKLNIDLPRQPIVDERPWLAAGLLLASIILLMSAYAYFDHIKEGTSSRHQKENSFKRGSKSEFNLFVK